MSAEPPLSLFDANGTEPEGQPARPLTAEQRAAVVALDGSRALHANAGSGKTRVIVERFVHAVREHGVDPTRILAITFTDKAAGELKQRLRERFLRDGDRANARAAETAFVSTIHGFCTRLLRAHPLSAGIDPDFAVLADAEGRRLRRDAFDAALASFLDEAAEQNVGALELAAAYKPDRLRELIFETHSRLRSAGVTRPVLPEVAPARAPHAERDRLLAAHAAATAQLKDVTSAPMVDRARAALDHCATMLAALGDSGAAAAADIARAGFKPGRVGALDNAAVAEYVEAHADYARACTDHAATRAVGLLGGLLETFGDEYAAGKRARNAVDFEDLELLARDLLRGDESLRRSYSERFELLMVDEFQDTNALQLSLLDLVENDNLLVVGDELQSIYGFRHADVGLFRARRDELAAAGRTALLAANFRARREILDVLNFAFAGVFGDSATPLEAGREAPPARTPLVELLVTDATGWERTSRDLWASLPATKDWRHAEARLLAQRIGELVAAGEVKPGEVAVLLRAATDIEVYERALAECGLSTYVAGGAGYWSRRQVQDLIAYLAALANPRDELRLFELLASPLAGVSSDGLALAAQARRALNRDLWWTLEQGFCEGGDGSADLAARMPAGDVERLRSFCTWFARERAAAPRHALDELLERAIAGRGYDVHTLRLPDGVRRMANVRKLLRLAREYEAQEGRDVRGFIDFVSLADELGTREGEAPVDSEDMQAVRLMTIHGAKGLEFGTVCVADLGRPPHSDHPDLLIGDGKVGLRLASLDGETGVKALDYERLRERRAAADLAEERRVLYVAMTRARERLILSGAVPFDAWPAAGPTQPALAWIGQLVAPGVETLVSAAQPFGEFVHEFEGRRAAVAVALNSPETLGTVLRVEPPAGVTAPGTVADRGPEATGEPPAPITVARGPGVRSLSYSGLEGYARCGYRFYAERVLHLPPTAPPGSEEPAEHLDALSRGTLAHLLLERMDFRRPAPPSAAEVTDLAEAQGMTLGDADADDLQGLIAAFASSRLRERLASAGAVRREAPFAFELAASATERVLINGVVDVIARSGDDALVVDYKSDRLGGQSPTEHAERDYGTQRLVYALAALRDGAAEVEVVHCFLERPDDLAVARFEAAELPALQERLSQLAAGVLASQFEVSSTPHRRLCQFCPARGSLCSWDSELTMREEPAPVN